MLEDTDVMNKEVRKELEIHRRRLINNHLLLREHMKWGTYGKNGDQPLKYVKIKDMDTAHIEACLTTQHRMSYDYRVVMAEELRYRESI